MRVSFVVLLLLAAACGSLGTRRGESGNVTGLPTVDVPSGVNSASADGSTGLASATRPPSDAASAAEGGPSTEGTALPEGTADPSNPSAGPNQTLPRLGTPPERPLYVLNVSLDYEKGLINAQQRIEFKNPTNLSVTELKFSVPPARRANALTFRDARIYGAKEPLQYELNGPVLTVKLPAALEPNQAIAITFDFTVQVPLQEQITGIGGDDTSRGPNAMMAGHWYIVLPPFKDGNWDLPEYVPVGDPFTSELADFEVSILAPEGVTIAAGGDETQDGRLWRYSLPKARVFAFAASDVYVVDTMTENGVTYMHYGFPRHQKFAEDVMYTAQRTVELFGRLYGPYIYKTLRVVETDRSQGQEYSGMVGIGSVLYQNYSGRGGRHDVIATTAHEVAHQWWFNVVGNDQVRTPWLDESFARYGELKFYQEFYPNDVDWWYTRYIEGRTPPKGAIDLTIYDYADAKAYVDAVYRNGVEFMRAVRDKVGRETMDAILRDYYQAEAYQIATPDDFFDAIARRSSEDISGIVKAYFAREVTLPCKISANVVGCRP